ncbi:MAG TPA: FAD-dependent oxidoreductase [Stellaceae bacterium]|nr:FAD-dependent oxidoreductase [Stellaceae bacterium]
MKTQARVAVIGGGIMGCAMLYHLVRQGCRDAVLIEKGELTSGSTWHAAGQVPHFAESPLFARIQYESFESYKRLAKEIDEPTGVHAVGSLRLARTEDEVREYKRYMAFARPIGIEADLIGPNETRALWPLLEFDGFKAALHTTLDGYTDPSQTTQGFAKAARAGGAEIYRNTRVTGISRTAGGEWRIETSRGAITVEIIINAAGFWGPEISAMVGGYLPILAMEHEYFVTEQAPELAQIGREMPVLRDLNVPTYLRQERQGLLVACYESHPVFWGLDGIPRDFGQELFEPDIERAAPQLEITSEMVPALKRLGVKTVVNGPTGRTADLRPCIGPAHGLPNYYTFCGAVGGFLQCGFGRYLAEWILEGEPSIDLSPVDVRRFGSYATQPYAVAKVSVGHAYSNPVYYPHGEPSRGRPARVTPLFTKLLVKGASFGVENGWEVPNWFVPAGVTPDDGTRFERQAWVACAGAEARAARDGAGVLDLSSRGKFEVEGASAAAILDRLCAARLPDVGHVVRAPFLTAKGHVASVLTIERLAEDRFYLTGEGRSEQRDLDWLQSHLRDTETNVTNVTARDGILWLGGARSPEILRVLGMKRDFSAAGQVKAATIGFARVRVLRIDDVTSPAFLILHGIDSQLAIYEALEEVGTAHGLKDIGRRAHDALRIARGHGSWGIDFAADVTPTEAGLAGLVAREKADFLGKSNAQQSNGKRLVRLAISHDGGAPVDPWGFEPVFAGDRAVGAVTSGSFDMSREGSVALALVDMGVVTSAAPLSVEILGTRRRAVIAET